MTAKRRANLHEIYIWEKSNLPIVLPLKSIILAMLKRVCIIISFSGFFLSSPAQFDTLFVKTNIQACADSLAAAFKSKNWELFTRYSYPALIGSIGGKKEFIAYVSQTFMQIPDSAVKKYETGRILQVVKTSRDFQTVIELNSVIELQGMRITTTSYMIGESWDGGLFWTFFDSQSDALAATQIKPDLSEQLIIPKKNEKVERLDSLPASSPVSNRSPANTKNKH